MLNNLGILFECSTRTGFAVDCRRKKRKKKLQIKRDMRLNVAQDLPKIDGIRIPGTALRKPQSIGASKNEMGKAKLFVKMRPKGAH